MSLTVNGLDELKKLAGGDLGTSEWIEVTQERINTFADATGDHQWIHVDPERAAEGPFGAPIAHGYLTLSLFIPLFTELLDVQGVTTKVNYGLNKVRFPAPVKVGSRIRLVARLAEVEDVPGGVQIAVDGSIEIEGGAKPAAVLQSLSRFYARAPGQDGGRDGSGRRSGGVISRSPAGRSTPPSRPRTPPAGSSPPAGCRR